MAEGFVYGRGGRVRAEGGSAPLTMTVVRPRLRSAGILLSAYWQISFYLLYTQKPITYIKPVP